MTEYYYPLAVVAFWLLALLRPSLLVWRRSGVWPVVFTREAAPLQRVIGAAMSLFFVVFIAWSFATAWVERSRLLIVELPPAVAAAGWVMMLAGTLMVLLAQKQMGDAWRVGIDERPTELVSGGLFGWSRNPIFLAMDVVIAGAVLVVPSPFSFAGAALAVALISVQVRHEEAHLMAMHGESYAEYAKRVGRFLPWWGRLN